MKIKQFNYKKVIKTNNTAINSKKKSDIENGIIFYKYKNNNKVDNVNDIFKKIL